jgi:hypothetical protein
LDLFLGYYLDFFNWIRVNVFSLIFTGWVGLLLGYCLLNISDLLEMVIFKINHLRMRGGLNG